MRGWQDDEVTGWSRPINKYLNKKFIFGNIFKIYFYAPSLPVSLVSILSHHKELKSMRGWQDDEVTGWSRPINKYLNKKFIFGNIFKIYFYAPSLPVSLVSILSHHKELKSMRGWQDDEVTGWSRPINKYLNKKFIFGNIFKIYFYAPSLPVSLVSILSHHKELKYMRGWQDDEVTGWSGPINKYLIKKFIFGNIFKIYFYAPSLPSLPSLNIVAP